MRKLIFCALSVGLLIVRAQPIQFVDTFNTTLTAGCSSPCTSLTVASTGSLANGAAYFFASVRADGANTLETFLVTNVNTSTKVLTVAGAKAGTSASSHGSGAQVAASIMTKDAFTQMEADVQSVSIANAGTTGTTVNKLAKLTGAPSTVLITATTDTGGALGVVTAGAGTSGSALVQFVGTASCVYDGATTAGDYVQISSSTAGDCHDAGSTFPTSGQIVGRVLSTNGGGGTYSTLLFPPESKPGSNPVNTGTAGQIAYYSTTTTLSGASGMTNHGVILYQGSSAPASTGAGTAGQVLTSNGASSDPTFQLGGMTLVEQHTASTSASLDFTTCISSTYNTYQIEFEDIIPATDGTTLKLLLSTDGGSTFSTSTYDSAVFQATTNGATAVNTTGGTAAFVLATSYSNVSGHSLSGYAKLYNPGGSVFKALTSWTLHRLSSGDSRVFQENTYGHWATTTAVNAFRLIDGAGNITSGTARCYGLAK